MTTNVIDFEDVRASAYARCTTTEVVEVLHAAQAAAIRQQIDADCPYVRRTDGDEVVECWYSQVRENTYAHNDALRRERLTEIADA
jgi:hypothetical protein